MWEKIDMLYNQRLTKRNGAYGAKVFGGFEQKGRFWSMKSNGGYV
jgi:hypothetical protein